MAALLSFTFRSLNGPGELYIPAAVPSLPDRYGRVLKTVARL
jgi:hypothetical protein